MLCMKLDEHAGRELIALARECIELTLRDARLPPLPRRAYDPRLQQPRSAFVTLRADGKLRGCCGSLSTSRPLVEGIWHRAWASASLDPRFPPLAIHERPATRLHLSVLQPLRTIRAESEEALIEQLRPGRDGLVLAHNGTRVTFLPAVWRQLPDARQFVRCLKAKAGWREDFWAPDVEVAVYEVDEFDE